MDVPLTSLHECTLFIESQPPALIAARLLNDLSLCRSGNGTPSLLVYCLPARADPIAREISKDVPDVPLAVARMRYSNIVANIKSYLANLKHTVPLDGDGSIPSHMIPSDDDYHSTLKVLRYLQLPQIRLKVDGHGAADQIATIVQSQLELGPQLRTTLLTGRSSIAKQRKICYICRFKYTQPHHHLYPSLCHSCGEFNISSSALSLPSNLDLHGKTAVVTGGRVNLGYHTALRLLRCGASVIASTRYPHDAEQRYRAEPDSQEWTSRLRIVGADFRTAKDVFALVRAILECLEEWGGTAVAASAATSATTVATPKLDILINNAAQTLTDSVEREEDQIRREWLLEPPKNLEEGEDVRMVEDASTASTGVTGSTGMIATTTGYVPRLRGGQFESTRTLIENNPFHGQARQSSWVQRMSEIPYEDVISAHSINTFVPFILIRELMPFMRRARYHHHHHPQHPQDDVRMDSEVKPDISRKPNAYIINVSSREGLPERHIGNQPKSGQHVHTNMSKAALNMLTETEASKAWKEGRVAMNAVDPGYMSADPEWMKMVGRENEQTPLSWEDGVGRVLWVVAKGETENVPVWGKFLKHFVQIDPIR